MKKILLLITAITFSTYAQFDSLIFSRGFTLDYTKRNIHALGDQNSDGYDDFMIYDCAEQKALIFFGSNPVDTIPEFIIDINFKYLMGILDINDDGMKDILMLYFEYPLYDERRIEVYYGGVVIDTIPDFIFNPPDGTKSFGSGTVLKDFNEDGRSELVVYDPELRFSNEQWGCFYFYNTGSEFDTIPEIVICGDEVDSIRYYNISSSGDINGDGKTDFTFGGRKYDNSGSRFFRRFYLGNEQWDLTPDAEYFEDEHSFDVEGMQILDDLNDDGNDDIIMNDYGFYPYYFKDVILKGSFPIDTIPDWGLNTQNQGISNLGAISLGDMNGDGYNDFIDQTNTFYDNLKLWVGGDSLHEVADKTWFGGEEGFGRNYAAVGDVNGDGVDDIAIAAIPLPGMGECKSGRIYIFNGDTSVHGITSILDVDFIPIDFKLYDPYPNPFNPNTVISYQLLVTGSVRITVYDMLGKEVGILLDEEKPSGKHQIEFNASEFNLSSGVYFINLRITEGGKQVYTESKKITLLK
jgi:hypothetical protein